MTKTRLLALISTLALSIVSTGCQTGEAEEEAAASPVAADEATANPAASSQDVTYEPAYPEDVSPEPLGAEDAAQQATRHAHGGEEHSHEDGDPTHREDHSGDDHDRDR